MEDMFSKHAGKIFNMPDFQEFFSSYLQKRQWLEPNISSKYFFLKLPILSDTIFNCDSSRFCSLQNSASFD